MLTNEFLQSIQYLNKRACPLFMFFIATTLIPSERDLPVFVFFYDAIGVELGGVAHFAYVFR
jgi:hypothetical protein